MKLADYGVDAFQLTEDELQQDLASARVIRNTSSLFRHLRQAGVLERR